MRTAGFHRIPIALTALRALLGPVLLGVAVLAPNRAAFIACLCVAFLSDVFDGMIARRLGVATQYVRRLDSIADSIFYACAALAAWILYPQAVKDRVVPLLVLLVLELLRYALDYARYRREASYHMWSSKAWGVFLFLGFLALLGFGEAGLLLSLAIYAGILADAEGLLISLVLREWKHDVPTIFHAVRIRAGTQPP